MFVSGVIFSLIVGVFYLLNSSPLYLLSQFGKERVRFFACLGSAIGFGLIGFIDDYLKVIKKRSVGLTPKQKLVPQVFFALLFALIAYWTVGSELNVPFTHIKWDIGLFYIPLVALVFVAVDNSANLLDGLDGLCAGNSAFAFAAFALACAFAGGKQTNCAVFSFAMCASLIAFLRFNGHPARLFMGDVGSLSIGGALTALSVVTGNVLYLPLMLVTMLISSASDILQVVYMRRHRGAKLLKMSPLHHHFELSGIPETVIVTSYNIAAFAACALSLLGMI